MDEGDDGLSSTDHFIFEHNSIGVRKMWIDIRWDFPRASIMSQAVSLGGLGVAAAGTLLRTFSHTQFWVKVSAWFATLRGLVKEGVPLPCTRTFKP